MFLDPATALSNGIVYLVEVGLPDPLPYIIEDYFPCNNAAFNILVDRKPPKGCDKLIGKDKRLKAKGEREKFLMMVDSVHCTSGITEDIHPGRIVL
jgi:hypothetical protein